MPQSGTCLPLPSHLGLSSKFPSLREIFSDSNSYIAPPSAPIAVNATILYSFFFSFGVLFYYLKLILFTFFINEIFVCLSF